MILMRKTREFGLEGEWELDVNDGMAKKGQWTRQDKTG